MAVNPDREKEFSETTHREFDVGESTNLIELEYLAEQEIENDAYGAFIIVEYLDSENQNKHIQTEVWDVNDMDALYKAYKELIKIYKLKHIIMVTVVFIY